MSRLPTGILGVLVLAWLIAHLVSLGPVLDAIDLTLTWILGLGAASALVAALTTMVVGLLLGSTRPAWRRFVQLSGGVATVGGCGLVVMGLLHYRDTEPADVRWLVAGLVVLLIAGTVHGWVVLTERKLT